MPPRKTKTTPATGLPGDLPELKPPWTEFRPEDGGKVRWHAILDASADLSLADWPWRVHCLMPVGERILARLVDAARLPLGELLRYTIPHLPVSLVSEAGQRVARFLATMTPEETGFLVFGGDVEGPDADPRDARGDEREAVDRCLVWLAEREDRLPVRRVRLPLPTPLARCALYLRTC